MFGNFKWLNAWLQTHYFVCTRFIFIFLHSFKCEPLCQHGERQDTLQHSKNAYRFIVLVWLASLGLVNSVESDGLMHKPEVMWNNFQPVHSYFFLTCLYVPGVFWFNGWTQQNTGSIFAKSVYTVKHYIKMMSEMFL